MHETWHTILFGINYCVEVVTIKSHSHILEKLRVKLRFYGFLSLFGTFVHKVAQTWCVFRETLHTTLFGVYIFLKWLELKIIVVR